MRRDIPALPDLVFATALEPERLATWLPAPLELVGVNDDVLILRHGGRLTQVRVTGDVDHLTLNWTPLADDGGATVVLRLSLLGADRTAAELDHPDEAFATRLLDALANGVENAFTAG